MKWLRAWFPAILWMMVIFVMSSRTRIQVSQEENINFVIFKTLHIIEYFFLYLLMYRGTRYTFNSKNTLFWLFGAFILTVLYAASDEIHQTYVSTREGSPRDVIIDAIGACISWTGIEQLYPRLPKRLRVLVDRLLRV